MNNNAIKNGMRTVLEKEKILVSKISFTKITQKESQRTYIEKIILTLDDICGVEVDRLKNKLDEYLECLGIEYGGMLLDI